MRIKNKEKKRIAELGVVFLTCGLLSGCSDISKNIPFFSKSETVGSADQATTENEKQQEEELAQPLESPEISEIPNIVESPNEAELPETVEITERPAITEMPEKPEVKVLTWNPQWRYAEFSQVHGGNVILYQISEQAKTIAVNAGHGTAGGSSFQTFSHPDGSAKVTGGTTAAGAVYSTAVSGGTTMLDGKPEAEVNLMLAKILKEKLLDHGFNVCMIREDADVQLDNIARTVFANENADCHIALHFDSTENDKGFFYIGVPEVESYRNMEPVASCWMMHQELGEHILQGMQENGRKIFGSGRLDLDLTQTSYSTIPSVDLEVGDRGSNYSEENLNQIADGIVAGLQKHFPESSELQNGL